MGRNPPAALAAAAAPPISLEPLAHLVKAMQVETALQQRLYLVLVEEAAQVLLVAMVAALLVALEAMALLG
jgi:hypothetical protein